MMSIEAMKQEPVGEIVQAFDDLICVSIPVMPPVGTKLYAAPPQREWVGLTDDDICTLAVEYDAMSGDIGDLIKFARAIESPTRASVIGEWFNEGARIEREACAKLCQELLAMECAEAIRARGE